MDHQVTHESHDKDEKSCGTSKGQNTIISPLTYTYHRGRRYVFVASKRKNSISPPSIKHQDKGNGNMDKGEQKVQVRRIKRIKNTSQGPQFIDLDSENEDQELKTRLLLLEKYGQLQEWERDFDMAQIFIHYYKEEHKNFKEVKRGLALQKKMTKHYARKSMLASAKLKKALIELEDLKRAK